jgi:hypothetical protein
VKKIIVIGAYPATEYSQKMLSDCIDRVSDIGYDIMLASHYPVPDHIQSKVNYYIFDKENPQEPPELTPEWRYDTSDFGVRIKSNGHLVTVCRNIFNGINLANCLGYEFFYYMESDNLIEDQDIHKIELLRINMFQQDKKLILFKYTNEDHLMYESLMFAGIPQYFLNSISLPLIIEDIIKLKIYPVLEEYFYDQLHFNESEYLIVQQSSKDFYDKSTINKIGNFWKAEIIYDSHNDKYIFWVNNLIANPYSIKVKSNLYSYFELPPNGWWFSYIGEGSKLDIEVEDNDLITKKQFDLSKENLTKYKEIGKLFYR